MFKKNVNLFKPAFGHPGVGAQILSATQKKKALQFFRTVTCYLCIGNPLLVPQAQEMHRKAQELFLKST